MRTSRGSGTIRIKRVTVIEKDAVGVVVGVEAGVGVGSCFAVRVRSTILCCELQLCRLLVAGGQRLALRVDSDEGKSWGGCHRLFTRGEERGSCKCSFSPHHRRLH